ncbi:hypothetical protein P5673_021365 [Acropora cervicornis]|uniref:Uncharacterized protein n=1 Tax=Acropora cervicornis TaxID=6130 RepID=A0AAD9V0P3_ACRCE|nr:hypothetical protein P5673_021365 [Acropora cervicornis]
MGELFQLSVILHFPPEVYLRRGVGELAPLLVRALHENEISALQFLRGGLARVTVRSSAYREELLSSDFLFEDTPIPVTPADRPTISVYLRDLPVEISDGSVRSALESFGDVFSVRSTVYKDFPIDPVPDDSVPVDPVPATGSGDDGDLSSVSSDHPDPPAPDPIPSYPSLTVDDIPRRPRTKHTKRLSTQPTAFPFSSPKVPVIPRSKSVSFRKSQILIVSPSIARKSVGEESSVKKRDTISLRCTRLANPRGHIPSSNLICRPMANREDNGTKAIGYAVWSTCPKNW